MADSRLELMRSYLGLVAAGDFAAAESYLTDDVVMHWAGTGPVSGSHHGVDGYRAAVAKLLGIVDSFRVEPHDLLANQDHGVVLTGVTFTRGGDEITTNRIVVYHFAGEQISELWVIDEDQNGVDAFLS